MLRLGTLLFFGTLLGFPAIALAQVTERPAYLTLEAMADGELSGSLTVPTGGIPAELPATFARSLGCDPSAAKIVYETEIKVRCPETRPSALTFHGEVRLGDLRTALGRVGVSGLNLSLVTAHFSSLRLDPAVPVQDGSSDYHRAQYSLAELPPRLAIDGGFDIGQVRALAGVAAALMLVPLLILVLRPSGPLHLRAEMEGMLVLGWICWIWALFRFEAGPLFSFVFGRWPIGPLLAVLMPPLAAVCMGSRLSAAHFASMIARTMPGELDADYYRRMRFWAGATAACFLSSLLSLILFTFTNGQWSFAGGLVLTAGCVLRIRSLSRGGSRPLGDGELRKRVFELAANAGAKLKGVSILTSPTPRPPAAFATRWGVVLVNQGLLSLLSRREVDAVVCHEFSHFGPALKRPAMIGIYVLLVAGVLGTQWVPNVVNFVPLVLLAAYFLLKAWRRSGEFKADLDSVRWSRDPEAMITGLARVAYANGMPLDWSAPVSWMMAHPPTLTRIRAIGRAGHLSDSRVAELLASVKDPSRADAADHYTEGKVDAIPEDAAFSPALRGRLRTGLTAFALGAPIALGLPAVWLLERIGFSGLALLFAASFLASIVMHVGTEWFVGSVRSVARKRALVRHGRGVFVGLSPSPEPRLYDGMYQYDLGMLRFENGALEFAGDRARFTLDRRLVQRVWLGDGARHWTPRKVVYVECRPSPDAMSTVFSLQSFESWLWHTTMAKRLFKRVEQWQRGPVSADGPPEPCAMPQVEGSPNTSVSFRTAFRAVSMYSGIGFCVASVGGWLDASNGLPDLSRLLCPMAVCGWLSFFLVCPRLNWSKLKPVNGAASRVPADTQAAE